jgi:hypothetical protein
MSQAGARSRSFHGRRAPTGRPRLYHSETDGDAEAEPARLAPIVRRAEVGRLVPEATRGCASWDPLARIRGRAGHPFAGCGPLPLWGRSGPQSLAGMAPAPTPPAIAAVACARAGRQTPMPGAPNPARRKPADGARREDTPNEGHARREDEGSPHGEAANGNAATAAAIGRGARSGRTGGPSAWCGLTERASDLPALPKAARGGTCRRPRPRRGAGPALCQPSARSGGAQRWFGVGERRLAALSAYSG